MLADYRTSNPTRQGIRIFTVLTGLTFLGILAWHFVRLFFNAGAVAEDFVLAAALFGVFLGGIYPSFLGKQSFGPLVATWVGASVPLGTMLGLCVAYVIWVS